MAIYYWQNFSRNLSSRNFGDDINPRLLSGLFRKEIVESPDVCIVGIGTLLDSQKLDTIQHYKNKIVFSSGAGYGDLRGPLDQSWHISCVRGPLTAAYLSRPAELGVCDGAILLPEVAGIAPSASRQGVTFIPHIKTAYEFDGFLREACAIAGIRYLRPDAEFDHFMTAVGSSELVLSEAMHGAIVADAFRTPWTCTPLKLHNEFKWRDWCQSLELPYRPRRFGRAALPQRGTWLTRGYRKIAFLPIAHLLARQLAQIARHDPCLSDAGLLAEKCEKLREKVAEINRIYA